MKRFILTLFIVAVSCITVFCQVDDGGLKNALIELGIKPAYALIASILLTTVVLQAVPQKWAAVTVYLKKLFYFLFILFDKLDDKVNNLSKNQRAVKAMKKASGVIILLLLAGSLQAQPFNGFFKSSDQAVKSVLLTSDGVQSDIKPVLLIRPYVAMTAQAYNLKDKTVGFLNGAGFGLSYGKYTTVGEKAWCNWSVNASLLTQIKIGEVTQAQLGPAVSLGLLDNLFSAGLGYIDKKVLILFGVGYTF